MARKDNLEILLKCKSLHVKSDKRIQPRDWNPGEVIIPACYCQRCRDHMYDMSSIPLYCDHEKAASTLAESQLLVCDIVNGCPELKVTPNSQSCCRLDRQPSEHDLEIISVPPPIYRKDAKLKSAMQLKRTSTAPSSHKERPTKTLIRITMPDVSSEYSRYHTGGVTNKIILKQRPVATGGIGRNQQYSKSSPSQVGKSFTADQERAKIDDKMENIREEANRIPKHGAENQSSAHNQDDLHKELSSSNDRMTAAAAQAERKNKARTEIKDIEHVRELSQQESGRRPVSSNAQRPSSAKRACSLRGNVHQRNMLTINSSKYGARNNGTSDNPHKQTKSEQPTEKRPDTNKKQVNRKLDNKQVKSTKDIVSDEPFHTFGGVDQTQSRTSVYCCSSDQIALPVTSSLPHTQSQGNPNTARLFQVELNRAFTFSYFQFIPLYNLPQTFCSL